MTVRMRTTYSMWSLFRNCRKAADWRYLKEFVPLARVRTLTFGALIHDCLECWHRDRNLVAVLAHIDEACPNRAGEEEQRRTWHLDTAIMRGYAARYPTEEHQH